MNFIKEIAERELESRKRHLFFLNQQEDQLKAELKMVDENIAHTEGHITELKEFLEGKKFS